MRSNCDKQKLKQRTKNDTKIKKIFADGKRLREKLDLDNDEALKTGTNMGSAVVMFVAVLIFVTFARIVAGR